MSGVAERDEKISALERKLLINQRKGKQDKVERIQQELAALREEEKMERSGDSASGCIIVAMPAVSWCRSQSQ